jgi:hypothetical protein
MTLDIGGLRATLEIPLAADDTFPARFYERLFDAPPEVRCLFRSNRPGPQRQTWIVAGSAS